MSTIEATVSMLENMPADEQEQVFLFTQNGSKILSCL